MTYPYVKSDYRNLPLSQSNVDFLWSGQHDSFSRIDSIISKQSCCSSSMSGDSNAVAVASTSLDLTTNNIENRQGRIGVGNSIDAIDLSKPGRFGGVNNEINDKFSNSDSKIIATTTPYAGTASLLNSLMMLSEKVRPSSPSASLDLNYPSLTIYDEQHKSTMSIYQTYLTERALQKSKMRLSQVAPQQPQSIFDDSKASITNSSGNRDTFSSFGLDKKVGNNSCPSDGMIIFRKNDRDKKIIIEHKGVESPASNNILKDTSCIDETRAEGDALHAQATVRTEQNCIKFEMQIPKSVNDFGPIPLNKSINDHSNMDTLAEIAASSIKLDASKVTAGDTVVVARCEPQRSMATISYNASPQKSISKPSSSVQNEATATQKEISAKNIASEFLKIANEQDINYPISNTTTTTTDFDLDSSSSNSDITNESTNKQARRSSSLVRRTSGSTAHAEILISARTVVVSEDGFTTKSSNSKDLPMVRLPRSGTSNTTSQAFIQEDNGKVKCELCQQQFSKRSSLLLHMNVHYMNPQNKLRCDLCSQSFASQSRLQKHLQSDSHRSKANVVEATGTSTSTSNNPRPFKCVNGCDKSFRIQGHLAKHLRYFIIIFFERFEFCYLHICLIDFRSKTHIQTLENLGKLPTGTYALIEAHINLTKSTEIDTTDCDNALASFKILAEKLKSESETNYENYASDTRSNDTETRADDEPLDSDVSATKKRRFNEDCKESTTINESDDN